MRIDFLASVYLFSLCWVSCSEGVTLCFSRWWCSWTKSRTLNIKLTMVCRVLFVSRCLNCFKLSPVKYSCLSCRRRKWKESFVSSLCYPRLKTFDLMIETSSLVWRVMVLWMYLWIQFQSLRPSSDIVKDCYFEESLKTLKNKQTRRPACKAAVDGLLILSSSMKD